MIAKKIPPRRPEYFRMRKIIFLFVLMVLFCASVFAQAAKPTATPPVQDDADIVKITTALIQIDVTVTDKNGKVITDLQPDELEIFENGEKQKITNFSFVSNLRTVEEAPKDKNTKPAIL